jgi:hypothetical protein
VAPQKQLRPTAPLIFTENGSSYKLFGRASGGAAGARDLVGFSREAGAE